MPCFVARSALLALSMTVAATFGCGDDTNGSGGSGGSGGEGGAGGAGGAAAEPADLVPDSFVADALITTNENELLLLERASPLLQTEEALAYARQMQVEHTAALKGLNMLLTDIELEPEENEMSFRMTADTDQLISSIEMSDSEIVDAVFMDAQVATHEKLIALLDMTLLPETTDTQLHEWAVDARETAQRQLDLAISVQEEMKGPTGTR